MDTKIAYFCRQSENNPVACFFFVQRELKTNNKMETKKVLLSQVKVNVNNPRTITDRKLMLLAERLLVFPKMISIRPVVVDETMTILGGNMRARALTYISKMKLDDIGLMMSKTENYKHLTKAEQKKLLATWQDWLEKPTVEIVKANELSEAEKQEFIIADNASFGEWDYDKLANEWDSKKLASWGVDVWQPEKAMWDNKGEAPAPTGSVGAAEQIGENGDDSAGLPPELQGVDITPDELPKIVGDDEVAMERIIIVYPKERAGEVAKMVGLETINKVVYELDELIKAAE